jgi:tetratricopeptide (TPR) repeat protein
MSEHSSACPRALLTQALSLADQDDQAGLAAVETLLRDYRADPILHFLRGSLLAAVKRYDDAGDAMTRALEIAPDFAVARFQLGFLRLSSGDPEAARQVWAPLDALDTEDPLRLFADGLNLVAVDRFEEAKALLNRGLAANGNGPMNGDIRLILEGLEVVNFESEAAPTSSTHFLLAQQATRRTTH